MPDFEIAGAMSRPWLRILILLLIMLIATFNCYSGYSNYCLYPVSIVLAACCNALLLSSRDKWYLWIFDPYSWQLPLLHMSQERNGPSWTQPNRPKWRLLSLNIRDLSWCCFLWDTLDTCEGMSLPLTIALVKGWTVGNSDLNGPKPPRKYLVASLKVFFGVKKQF